MKNSFFFYLIFGVLLVCTSSITTKRTIGGDSRVIFFSGSKWDTECYVTKNSGNQCVWFSLAGGGREYSNLHELKTSYIEKYNCKNVRRGGGRGEGWWDEVCEERWQTMYWDSQIRSIYISDPALVVEIYDEPDFQGNGYRIWGKGGWDLTKYGWGDRAKSAKIFFR